MFAQITKILLCLALCLGLLSCPMHPPDYKCIEWQDAATIEAHYGSNFDSLAVRKDNKTIGVFISPIPQYSPLFLIGSKTHKAKFPININTQLFSHGTMLQNLDIEMPENSMLYFYQHSECEMLYDSTNILHTYERKDQFYRDVQEAIDNGVFIDSSSNEITCWMMKRMQEDNDWLRCTKEVQAQGIQDIFLNTSFGGFIVAPNAHVIVGQAEKEYAGQIYAKRITLHQDTRFLWVQPGSQQSMSIAAFNRGGINVCSNN